MYIIWDMYLMLFAIQTTEELSDWHLLSVISATMPSSTN